MSRQRTGLRFTSPVTPLVDNEVFAVDATTAQVVVRPGGEASVGRVRENGRVIECELARGAAALTVTDLAPDAAFEIEVLDERGAVVEHLTGRTRPTVENPIKIATVSDVHLGAEGFGPFKHQTDDSHPPFPVRCMRAAIAEATAWGAQALIIKGDLTDHGLEEEWEQAAELLATIEVPVMLTAGNHDVWGTRNVEPIEAITSLGLSYEPVQRLDVGTARVVLADTSVPGRGSGSLKDIAQAVADAVDTEAPTFLGLHHNLQRTPIPWFWPPGVSSTSAKAPLDLWAEANPDLFISSGHTHRNRAHTFRGFTYTEVSATADFPGVWAGYELTDTVIRQTVRRIAAPDAVRWTEQTRRAFGTIWPRWSQGTLNDRCVDSLID